VQTDRGFFHYLRSDFSSILKSRVGIVLTKAVALRINLNIVFTDFSSINLVSIFRCSSSTTNPVYERRVLINK